jgi:hypothetical protein
MTYPLPPVRLADPDALLDLQAEEDKLQEELPEETGE